MSAMHHQHRPSSASLERIRTGQSPSPSQGPMHLVLLLHLVQLVQHCSLGSLDYTAGGPLSGKSLKQIEEILSKDTPMESGDPVKGHSYGIRRSCQRTLLWNQEILSKNTHIMNLTVQAPDG